ncbi:MAG: hypothetical protein AAF721_02490 [Myxococcota bacterium]
MCRQIQRRLDIALGGELDDPALQGLWVQSVRPLGGASTLVVHVVAPSVEQASAAAARLGAARGYLREEIAAAIHRKRTPYLEFVVLAEVDG